MTQLRDGERTLPVNQLDLSLNELDARDIPQIVRLSERVGWDYDEAEVRTVMVSGKVYGHRNSSGEIVSSAAIVPYTNGLSDVKLASLGLVIVHPAYRGLGLGTKVTLECMQGLPKTVPIMLIATPEGERLYQRLGFGHVGRVQKFLCDHVKYQQTFSSASTHYIIEPYVPSDFAYVTNLDEAAFGARRDTFLSVRLRQAKAAVVAKNSARKIVGYALSIEGSVNLIVGPIVAPDSDTALHLTAYLAHASNKRLRIDIPAEQTKFAAALQQSGFRLEAQPPIMALNQASLPNRRNSHLFSIAAQVFG
ncbi:GNAT family N-acetyltransferase [Alicyclobacillus sp. SO9]|uniref:GNAT family N-acetyltransferase n=1 Tax=Alicyclobacillus sp. SO9 TaxID=2665646 RepID=UPI0018E7EB34|nr:GNAT family N-acetyltransferase [Alicyclobacillus sp. SO9]QQE78713.1 GNAT family N-acetyltransferase [Alicyclobacillus sp. SO9]